MRTGPIFAERFLPGRSGSAFPSAALATLFTILLAPLGGGALSGSRFASYDAEGALRRRMVAVAREMTVW